VSTGVNTKKVAMKIEIEQKDFIALLKDEYFYLSRRVEHLDHIGVKVKQWGVTVGLSGIGIAYWKTAPMLIVVSVISALIFWLIETSWKTYQIANYLRISEIEAFFAGKIKKIDLLQSNGAWEEAISKYQGFQGISSFIGVAFYKSVAFPHSLTAIMGIVLWLFFSPTSVG